LGPWDWLASWKNLARGFVCARRPTRVIRRPPNLPMRLPPDPSDLPTSATRPPT